MTITRSDLTILILKGRQENKCNRINKMLAKPKSSLKRKNVNWIIVSATRLDGELKVILRPIFRFYVRNGESVLYIFKLDTPLVMILESQPYIIIISCLFFLFYHVCFMHVCCDWFFFFLCQLKKIDGPSLNWTVPRNMEFWWLRIYFQNF